MQLKSLCGILLFLSQSVFALSIATYNIRNFDYDERLQIPTNKNLLKTTIAELSADLLAVQEINKPEVFQKFIAKNFENKKVALTECGGAHRQRLGFVYDTNAFSLVSFKQDLKISNPKGGPMCDDGSRPLGIAHFKIKKTNEDLIAITVHLKSGGRPKSIDKRFMQLKIIADVVEDFRSKGFNNFVILGDFNSTEYIFRTGRYDQFIKITAQMGLRDLSKKLGCTCYWWGNKRDHTQYPSILDHILISPSLLGKGSNWSVKTAGHCSSLRCQAAKEEDMGKEFDQISDHCPLMVEFQ